MSNSSHLLFKRIFIALLVQEKERRKTWDTLIRAKWRNANREHDRNNLYKWRKQNPEKIAAINHKHWMSKAPERAVVTAKNQAELKKKRAEHKLANYAANKQKRRDYGIKRRINRTPGQITADKKRSNDYVKERIKRDPVFRMMRSFRCRLAIFITRPYKQSGMNELIGCTGQALRAHFESLFQPGMDWTTYGRYGWHVDHKTPLSHFNLKDPEQLKQAWHYTNLQPLWWNENIRKQRLCPSKTICQPAPQALQESVMKQTATT